MDTPWPAPWFRWNSHGGPDSTGADHSPILRHRGIEFNLYCRGAKASLTAYYDRDICRASWSITPSGGMGSGLCILCWYQNWLFSHFSLSLETGTEMGTSPPSLQVPAGLETREDPEIFLLFLLLFLSLLFVKG
jgi:hypothetical protein